MLPTYRIAVPAIQTSQAEKYNTMEKKLSMIDRRITMKSISLLKRSVKGWHKYLIK